MQRKLVGPAGPLDAKIAFIGEALGAEEEAQNRPMAGMSGTLAKKWWIELGLTREEIYIDNVVPYRPKGNKIETVPPGEIHGKWIPQLLERLAKLTDPYVLVPTGNYACYALTGKGNVKGVGRRSYEEAVGITKLRGSIFTYNPSAVTVGSCTAIGEECLRDRTYSNPWGREVKVIPTIHPAAILHGKYKWEKRTRVDWKKIRDESLRREVVRAREYVAIEPTQGEINALCFSVEEKRPLSIDIETWGRTLSCVGFATDSETAYVMPTATKTERDYWLPLIKWLCESDCPKIFQNGFFDIYWLWAYGIEVKNYVHDTLSMHHCLDPAEDHDLSFLSSIYRPLHVFWKDEAKDADEVLKYARTRDAVHHYNAKDCMATFEVWQRLWEILTVTGMLGFYERHYRGLFEPLLALMQGGIRCDLKRQREWAKSLEKRCGEVREDLKAIAGEELYATKNEAVWRVPTKEEWGNLLIDPQEEPKPKNIDRGKAKQIGYVMSKQLVKGKKKILLKDFSGKKLQRLFYEKLRVPKQYKISHTEGGKEWRETLDKAALIRIALRHGKAQEPARLLMEHRRKAKVAVFLRAKKDRDGRIRCTYKNNTEAGRLASAKNPMGGGFNLQNQDREIRDTYLADVGQVWIGFDGSQVEDRVCKMLTGARRMRDLANLRPDEFDAHQWMAERIGTIRYNAKTVTHAAQRGMRGKKLAEVFLREDEVIIPVSECDRMLDAYLEAMHEIRDLYFPWIKEILWANQKRMANSWGRMIDFGTEKFDEDLYRRAYSWPLQSECVDWLNQWGFLPTYWYLKGKKSRLLTQEHDGFGVSTEPGEAWDLCQRVVGSLERPRVLRGGSLTIPVTITVGRSWAGEKDGGVEFKRLPGREELEEAVRRCLV